MKPSAFETKFSVVCLPENTNLFMMNMQVFEIRESERVREKSDREPQSMVWCAVFQRPVIKKI